MLKNKKAIQLSLYFAVALVAFSIIIGGIYVVLFRSHTIRLHENQLSVRAKAISAILSEHMTKEQCVMCGMDGCKSSYKFLAGVAGADIWVVDKELDLIVSSSGRENTAGKNAVDYRFTDLPENAESLINEVFTDKTVFSEDFSGFFSESTLTVGVSVKDMEGTVIGVVLLHSPINGVNGAISEGMMLLFISMLIALIVAIILSFFLSKSFTDPIVSKEAQDALRLENIRREFVANISHELKTPITVILGSLEALIDKVVTDEQQVDDYHNQMLREASFLQRLVGDLLDLSKLQNTDFIIERQYISVCDILDDVVRSAKHTANIKSITINVERDNAELMIYGDYGRIRQMLMIILDNAVKFSREQSAVDIVLRDKTVFIRDYGSGIPKSELPYIFDRFYKSHSEQNKTGVGLGLAIAKQIADRHNIELSVQSTIGKGTVFIIKMP